MTDLILVGHAALHDGECHPEALQMGTYVYHCDRPEADDVARTVAEYLFVYRHGMLTLPSAKEESQELLRFIPALCEWAELDTEGVLVKVKELRTEDGGVSGLFPTYDSNRRVTVWLTEDFDALRRCDRIHTGDRRIPADADAMSSLYRTYREACHRGLHTAFLMTRTGGETTAHAMITYAPHVCRQTAGFVKSFEQAGIRVTAFLRDVSHSNTRTLAACGLTETTPAHRPTPDGDRPSAVSLMESGCRSFEGCSEAYVLDCIRELRAAGRIVGVLATEAEDLAILSAADIPITCAPSLYASSEDGIPKLPLGAGSYAETAPDGLPEGKLANDRLRRVANVVVRRASERGGGITGVRRALLAADGFKSALDRSVRFVLLSQAISVVMTVLPLCLGLAAASAPALLLSGMAVDLLIILASITLPLRHEPLPRRSLDSGLTKPWLTHLPDLISVAVAAALPWVVAGIASLAGVRFGGDLFYFGFLCTAGLQLAVFRTHSLPRRDRTAFFTTLLLALVYVGALAAALGGGLALLWAIPLPAMAPLTYLLLRAVLRRALGKRKTGK